RSARKRGGPDQIGKRQTEQAAGTCLNHLAAADAVAQPLVGPEDVQHEMLLVTDATAGRTASTGEVQRAKGKVTSDETSARLWRLGHAVFSLATMEGRQMNRKHPGWLQQAGFPLQAG